jgi:hypothetical protein
MKNFVAFILLVSAFALPVSADSQSAAAFKKLQSLVGDWVGKDDMGMEAKTNFKSMIANTVVMETLSAMHMEDMLTIYTVDGNSIALAHYCPTNNQPRMRATPGSGPIKELTFSFQGAGNMASDAVGHQHKLVLHFEDDDHITEEWTWRKDGKDSLMVIHFTRKKS